MTMRRWALCCLLAAPGCTDDSDSPRLPPAVTKVVEGLQPQGRVALVGKLTIASVVDSDPLLTDLPRIVGADASAKGIIVEIGEDHWSHPRSGQEHRVPYLVAKDRAGLASYVGQLIAREPQLRPAEGHGFAYEQIPSPAGDAPRWRTHLVDRTEAISPREVESIELREDPQTGTFDLLVEFTAEDGAAFSDLTENRVGHKLAIMVGERVVSAPVVNEPIPGNTVVVTPGRAGSADGGKTETQRLLAELRGDPPP